MPITTIQSALLYIVLYTPPVLAGILTFRKLRRKYSRPLDKTIDWKVWVFTVIAVSGTLLCMMLLYYTIVFFLFIAPLGR